MNLEKLNGVIPTNILSQISQCEELYGIDNEVKLANFLGQCSHESLNFIKFIENLNYSGNALWSLFKSHFSSIEEATSYERQPKKIANRIYANRMGNGDENSGDGWLHRGVGAIQLTGKELHQKFFSSLQLPENSNPMDIATKYSLISVGWFWNTKKLNYLCVNCEVEAITKITKIINGGFIGLDERIKLTQKYYSLIVN